MEIKYKFIYVDDDNFNEEVIEEHYKNNRPFILYFTSAKCSPCLIQKKLLKKLFKNTHIDIYLVDIDNENVFKILDKYFIRSVPTIYFYDSNQVKRKKHIGIMNEQDLFIKVRELKKANK
jgi:thioredoxin-like negative regulator of GroEL